MSKNNFSNGHTINDVTNLASLAGCPRGGKVPCPERDGKTSRSDGGLSMFVDVRGADNIPRDELRGNIVH